MEENRGPLLLSLVSFLDSLGLRKAAKVLRKDGTAQGLLTGEEELFPGSTLPQVVARGLREKKKRHREAEEEVEAVADPQPCAEELGGKKQKKAKLAEEDGAVAGAPEEPSSGAREKKQKEKKSEGKKKRERQQAESAVGAAEGEAGEEDLAAENGDAEERSRNGERGHKNKQSSVLQRFKRVDESKWVAKIAKEDLKDNSFWNKKADSFAVKAAQDLGKVRGRDFRHEKTKKKRASWKGCGEIPMTVNSIQFDSSDDE
ncbi:putative nucleolar phosphoprotein p130 [Neospora caninum Liverpool]|uniref:Nucleolar phosphoprotein p130, putative n=1 Tax=Neospora caninum (strain Liverpool) TaxID=572307 RepID=F0V885_NEOCL|nr:putative nucleolar phosphoprotein p130 [Neospora caninum Liverpool]CBZ49926.1 putative nucleolar phosphoprotein p130 [Neospora caninum Liverpool]CEL64513.1 TPA: nucleolar phosphoprotein p130, putative [Neospora caninum Liverpool]|eukprot:XP_003879961.1 putative nucleolar phosphoprotein p130 [Neospora caninum Liverpool]